MDENFVREVLMHAYERCTAPARQKALLRTSEGTILLLLKIGIAISLARTRENKEHQRSSCSHECYDEQRVVFIACLRKRGARTIFVACGLFIL